ncbi:MAG: DUF2784 domain-containing protein [Bryobacteraceae bacterium]
MSEPQQSGHNAIIAREQTVGFEALAALTFVVHLLFIAWVALGGVFVEPNRLAARLHLASLAWGLLIQLGPWPCPLTLAEQYFLGRAGRTPYRTGFLLHYLDKLVYPDLPGQWLTGLTVTVCAANLWLHARTWRKRRGLSGEQARSAQSFDAHRSDQA